MLRGGSLKVQSFTVKCLDSRAKPQPHHPGASDPALLSPRSSLRGRRVARTAWTQGVGSVCWLLLQVGLVISFPSSDGSGADVLCSQLSLPPSPPNSPGQRTGF